MSTTTLTPTLAPPSTEKEKDCGCQGAKAAPSMTPGVSVSILGGSNVDSRPQDTLSDLASSAGSAGDSAPSLPPPQAAASGTSGGGITAWNNDKRVNGLWAINQNRNSWVSITAVGWKKLANNSDSAVVALTILGAHARNTQTPVNYRDEADGMIHEMYVW